MEAIQNSWGLVFHTVFHTEQLEPTEENCDVCAEPEHYYYHVRDDYGLDHVFIPSCEPAGSGREGDW